MYGSCLKNNYCLERLDGYSVSFSWEETYVCNSKRLQILNDTSFVCYDNTN